MISIVIPTYNGAHHLCDCLSALQRQTRSDFEIIIVDNNSSDGTVDYLNKHWPDVRLIMLPRNSGFAAAVNRGIEASRGDYVALLNNDTIVEPKWLESLATAMDDDESIGACASCMLLLSLPGYIDTIGDGFTIAGFGYKRGWLERLGTQHENSQNVFGACAGAALYRKTLFNRIGLFDESYFAFIEDLDLAFRAQSAGYSVRYVPEARVRHKLRATAGQGSPWSDYLCYRNQTMLVLKDFPYCLILLYLPHILAHNGLVLLRYAVKGGMGNILRAYSDAFRQWKNINRERRFVQSRRSIRLADLRRKLEWNWIAVHFRLSSTLNRLLGRRK